MNYRKDIDGLRAISVLSVIAFHSGINSFSGGYIGVDVFFVISGFLITNLIHNDLKNRKFSFSDFYKRRVARLLPSLSITLSLVLIFGFFFYDSESYDSLGKEVFFASFGAANILFAEGINYFAEDLAFRPLTHLWSLGVEEQFYLIWPLLLMILFKIKKNLIFYSAVLLFFFSFLLSIYSVSENQPKGYFLLHYRAFELLVGVITALLKSRNRDSNLSIKAKRNFSILGIILIVFPILTFDENTRFPGFNALIPCLGAAFVIYFPCRGYLNKILSSRALVFIGLISYPLYLYHQPIISYFGYFDLLLSPYETFLYVTISCGFFAWLTYKFVEIPIRSMVSKSRSRSFIIVSCLIATMPIIGSCGLFIAKTGGFNARFKFLNPYALEVSQAHAATFHSNFERGFKVKKSNRSKALFFGDSLLQQYVLPISNVLNLKIEDVDTVTRGGCVLLKGTEFIDKFADISSDELYEKLYSINKTYDYVIFSQSWESYEGSVMNFSEGDDFRRWQRFINATIDHFLKIAKNVIIIGSHPSVSGTQATKPSLTLSKEDYLQSLLYLKVENLGEMEASINFFQEFHVRDNVQVIEPYRIFGLENSILHDGKWSFFSDAKHLSKTSTNHLIKYIDIQINYPNEIDD